MAAIRDYTGTDKRDPHAIQRIDYFLRDLNRAIANIDKGKTSSNTTIISGTGDHHLLSNLGLSGFSGSGYDDHPHYLNLFGRAGGQTAYGGVNPGNNLVLSGTSDATKGSVIIESGSLTSDVPPLIVRDATGAATDILMVGRAGNDGQMTLYGGTDTSGQLWLMNHYLSDGKQCRIKFSSTGSFSFEPKDTGDVVFTPFGGSGLAFHTIRTNTSYGLVTTAGNHRVTPRGAATAYLEWLDNSTTTSPSNVGFVPLIITRNSGQTGHLLDIRDSNNATVLSYFDASGHLWATVNGAASPAAASSFPDGKLLVWNTVDSTKAAALSAENIATATLEVFKFPTRSASSTEVLKSTILAMSGRAATDVQVTGTNTSQSDNTVAGTKDGSDLTYDSCGATGDNSIVNILERDITYVFDTITTYTVTKVEFIVRARATTAGAGGTATVNTFYKDYALGASSVGTLTGSFQDFTVTMATNPETSRKWLPSDISGGTFGFRMSAQSASNANTDSITVFVSELTLKVYGYDARTLMADDTGVPLTVLSDMREPTGFADHTPSDTSTLSWTDSTPDRTFTITPVSGTFSIYSAGTKYAKSATTKQISTTVGLHYIYFDTTGTIQETAAGPWDISSANVPIATVYWDGAKGVMADERHGIQMDGATQEYIHETRGPAFVSGMAVTPAADGTTHTVGSGEWYDDDLEKLPGTQTTSRFLYRSASGGLHWTWDAPTAYIYKTSGSAPYYDSAGTLTAVDVGKYSASWVFATNDTAAPTCVMMGQDQYNTKALAEAAGPDTISFGTSPFAEMLLLARVVWQRNGAGITVSSTTDYRRVTGGAIGTFTPVDHAALKNLDYASSGHTGFVAATAVGTIASQDSNNVNISGGSITGITDLAIADGGTGASSLAAANIPYVVARTDLTSLSASTGVVVMASAQPVGFYRCSFWLRLTTAGSSGDKLSCSMQSYIAGGYKGTPFTTGQTGYDYAAGLTLAASEFLVDGTTYYYSCVIGFYHDDATKDIKYNLGFTKTGSPVCQARLRLEYLGA